MTRFLLLALAAPALGHAQTAPASAWTNHSRVLPDELRRLPVGLTLWHTPNPVYPTPNPDVPGGYVWKHRTAVRAEEADLEIVVCGSYIWYSDAGWQRNLRETPAEFAELFDCPGGKLKRGVTYTFTQNYRLRPQRQAAVWRRCPLVRHRQRRKGPALQRLRNS
jgi:hypothetical protein